MPVPCKDRKCEGRKEGVDHHEKVLRVAPSPVALPRSRFDPVLKVSLKKHRFGGLRTGAEQADHLAGFVAHGSVGEGEMSLVGPPRPLQLQGQVIHVHRLTGEHLIEQGREFGLHLRPDYKEATPEGLRVAA